MDAFIKNVLESLEQKHAVPGHEWRYGGVRIDPQWNHQKQTEPTNIPQDVYIDCTHQFRLVRV